MRGERWDRKLQRRDGRTSDLTPGGRQQRNRATAGASRRNDTVGAGLRRESQTRKVEDLAAGVSAALVEALQALPMDKRPTAAASAVATLDLLSDQVDSYADDHWSVFRGRVLVDGRTTFKVNRQCAAELEAVLEALRTIVRELEEIPVYGCKHPCAHGAMEMPIPFEAEAGRGAYIANYLFCASDLCRPEEPCPEDPRPLTLGGVLRTKARNSEQARRLREEFARAAARGRGNRRRARPTAAKGSHRKLRKAKEAP